jgi:hypothetical protein
MCFQEGGTMPRSLLLVLVGVVAVTGAGAWWLAHQVRRWRTAVRLRRVQAYHASLRAEVRVSYERIYTRCAARPAWAAQKLADMEWAFAQIDGVLERRRLDDLAEVGRTTPPVARPVIPAVLGSGGAVALMIAALIAF